MRSIPFALTLDTLRRGRWTLPAAALGVNAMPLMLLTALRGVSAIDRDDPSHIIMHVVLTQVNMWVFGVAVMSAQGSVSKLFALPVSTTSLVFWRLSLLVVLALLQSLLSTLVVNALFGVDWPLWGPALLLAVSMAAAQAIVWYADKSLWSVPMLAVLALTFGTWMKSRYGGLWSPPEHYWRQVTLADAAFMLSLLAVAYLLGVAGVARNRQGEPPLSLGVIEAMNRFLQGNLGAGTPFRSPVDAQFWFEWRKKGWVMPAGASFGLLLALAGWLVFSRDPREMWEGVFALGGCLTILALIAGFILGHNGASDGNYDLGSFLATRPLRTTSLAHILLKVSATSILLAWLMWLTALAVAYAVLWTTSTTTWPMLPEKLHWSYFPLTLLGPWVAATLGASVGLSGRLVLFIAAAGGLFAAWIALLLFGRLVLSPEAQDYSQRAFLLGIATLCVAGTSAAFIAAWRRKLIGWPAIYVGASLWLVLTAAGVVTLAKELTPLQSLAAIALASATFALAVAPLATAPLALAWNRNR